MNQRKRQSPYFILKIHFINCYQLSDINYAVFWKIRNALFYKNISGGL